MAVGEAELCCSSCVLFQLTPKARFCCRGEVEDPMCEEPGKIADECCSEVYDGTLLEETPSAARALVAGGNDYIPYYSTMHLRGAKLVA